MNQLAYQLCAYRLMTIALKVTNFKCAKDSPLVMAKKKSGQTWFLIFFTQLSGC